MVRRAFRTRLPEFDARASLARAGRGALDFAYPERCVHCGHFGSVLCAVCLDRLRGYEPPPRCGFCAAQWSGTDNCPRCFAWDALDGAVAPFEYEAAPRDMVRALKYRHTRSLAGPMAGFLRPLLPASDDIVVAPVPLHRRRERQRGFNHARLITEHLGLPTLEGRLHRTRNTRAQFGLTGRQRITNVSGAFRYDGPSLEGAHVLLVDDVVTTGATANECARVLKDAGARTVRALAFSRASYQPGTGAEAIDT